jgi:hypothetical protein
MCFGNEEENMDVLVLLGVKVAAYANSCTEHGILICVNIKNCEVLHFPLIKK